MAASVTRESTVVSHELMDEINSWLGENWSSDLTVGEWWRRLGEAGWSSPGLPENAYGRALERGDVIAVQGAIRDFGALGAPGGLGLLLAAPTIATHGTQEQIDLYVRDIVTGQKSWCQLFSEPGAGSDLAGLTTRAELDGDEWIINGQKVWTSFGSIADLGMLIARTSPDSPKHRGISWFAFDMDQDGVEVRPLVEMTGHALFNEVFITDARVADAARIGDLNNGWAVANTTLAFERAGLGTGGGNAGGSVVSPGSIAGFLDREVGEFVQAKRSTSKPAEKPGGEPAGGQSGGATMGAGGSRLLIELAKGNGSITNPSIRQDLMRLYTLDAIGKFNNLRVKAAKAVGQQVGGMANIAKLSMSESMRLTRDVGLGIVGASGMLHGYKPEAQASVAEATHNPFLAAVTGMALWAQGPSIYGGTDQIQRNIIGERVLGLPKEPRNDVEAPFSSLPKNA